MLFYNNYYKIYRINEAFLSKQNTQLMLLLFSKTHKDLLIVFFFFEFIGKYLEIL